MQGNLYRYGNNCNFILKNLVNLDQLHGFLQFFLKLDPVPGLCFAANLILLQGSEPEPPGAGVPVFGWSRSRHFGPAPAPPYIFVK